MSVKESVKHPELLFVYDRICTQEEKEREIGGLYGIGVCEDNPSREQTYRGSFADEGHRRAVEAARDPSSSPSRPGVTAEDSGGRETKRKKRRITDTDWFGDRYSTRTGTWVPKSAGSGKTDGGRSRAYAFSSANDGAYTYRPGKPEGGEAVKDEKNRFGREWFADIFASPSEKGREELRDVKKEALKRQKAREYRHAVLTALMLTAVFAFAVVMIYKTIFVVRTVDVTGSERYSAEEVGTAAGIAGGDNLYSFRSADAADQITFRLPWIRTAEISRSVPDGVTVVLTDDEARYYADIWGDTVLLSASLKVLEVLPERDENSTADLVELVLPPVKKSVAGRPLVFEGSRAERYIRNVLAAASDSGLMQNGLLEEIDLTGEYEIRMKACGLYDLKCAGESDMTAKLRMAYEIIRSGQLAEGIPASFDLTSVEPVSVIYDFTAEVSP